MCACARCAVRLSVSVSVNRIQMRSIIVRRYDLCSLYRGYRTIILVTITINSALLRDIPVKLRLKKLHCVTDAWKWCSGARFSLRDSGESLIRLSGRNVICDSCAVRFDGIVWKIKRLKIKIQSTEGPVGRWLMRRPKHLTCGRDLFNCHFDPQRSKVW